MFVRIARFEGGDLAEADQAVARVKEQMQGERPPGLEGAKRMLMLIDREEGRGLGLTFFETEEDMRRGDEALNAMSPGGSAQRTSVEMYEVGIDQQF
jgi:hypothetical protein